ncbi:MAG: adenylate/guanylate cyclase domain-containing protein [Azospirillaceae bacterium]
MDISAPPPPAAPAADPPPVDEADRLVDWLLGDARHLADAGSLLAALGDRLVAQGVPLWRATFHLPLMHPQLYAVAYEWHAAGGPAVEHRIDRNVPVSGSYFHSPVGMLHRTGAQVRRRLSEGETDFPVLEDLRAQGATDYALSPLRFGGYAYVAGFGMSSQEPGGFTDHHLTLIERILPALSTTAELMVTRSIGRGLLEVYLGHDTAERILSGQVTAGSGRSIDSIIVFTDMRGFTHLSEHLDRADLLELLSDYFGAIVPPIRRAGGEILKFMGDGLLAVFNLDTVDSVEEACARAMIAALEAEKAIRTATERRVAQDKPVFTSGFALHRGRVIYGNIGAEDRLDFTVVGPAVNLASRLEQMTRVLDRPILASSAFAEACPVMLEDMGEHMLRGIGLPHRLFAPGLSIS